MADLSKIKLNGTTYNLKDAAVPAWAKAENKPTYTAAEVGATTTSDVNALIASAIGNINQLKITTVTDLPTTDIDSYTIYLKTKSSSNNDNIYDEYIYINNNWELIGNTAVDLTGYLQTTDISDWAKSSTKPTYTASEVGAISNEYIGYLESNYLYVPKGWTYQQSPDYTQCSYWLPFYLKSGSTSVYSGTYLRTIETSTNLFSMGIIYLDGEQKTGNVQLSLSNLYMYSYNDGRSFIYTLANKGDIPTVPTKTSDLTNDSGFLTSFTETDPTVPSWAKASTKPTYTASEVGALPDTYTAPVTSVNGATGTIVVDKIKTTASNANTEYNLVGTTTTDNNTAAVAEYKQDLLSFAKTSDLSRLTIGSTATPGTVRLYTSTSGANGYADIKANVSSTNTRTITLPDASGTVALTDDIPDVPSWALASSKPTYTASEVGATTSSDVSGMISTALDGLTGFSTEIVQTLPASGVAGTFYFVTGDNDNPNDIYEEYLWINNGWEKLGNFDATNIDLNGYLQTTDIADWAKAASKPTYTASEVGALASNTAYVSTFNGQSGAITYTPPVSSVNGQTGVVELTIPADTSELTNGAGFLTSFTETDPTVPSWAKASTKPSYTASEVGAMATTHAANSITSSDISNWNGKTNNTGTVTSVRVQATSPVQSSTSTAQSTTLNTTISLASGYGDTQNPYASKTKNYVLAAPSNANGVPSFRALVASDLPAIGNITNGGDITANATIASGDRLIINDESASKVINSSITFGSSTKQYLANNGTWQNAYDDTALAARVTALEQLEWATYYSGRSNPSNSQGQNGDIYLQY